MKNSLQINSFKNVLFDLAEEVLTIFLVLTVPNLRFTPILDVLSRAGKFLVSSYLSIKSLLRL